MVKDANALARDVSRFRKLAHDDVEILQSPQTGCLSYLNSAEMIASLCKRGNGKVRNEHD